MIFFAATVRPGEQGEGWDLSLFDVRSGIENLEAVNGI